MESIRRAALIVNPQAGRGRGSHFAALEGVIGVLRQRGIEAETISTRGPGTAGAQTADAVERGADLIFACGGDGTVHEVLQGLAGKLTATLGVLPFGSANALARHLNLATNPADAMRKQLDYVARPVPLGRITYQTAVGTSSRYFAVMAGAGPDGMLVHRMPASGKHRLGRSVYYLRAAKLFLSSRFPSFRVSADPGAGAITQEAVSAIAVRVGDLGGLFSPLARGASPADPRLLLTVTRPPSHVALPAWFVTSWARAHGWNPYTKQLQVESFTCTNETSQRVPVQADGEFLGFTPMQVELVPAALRLLMPPSLPAAG